MTTGFLADHSGAISMHTVTCPTCGTRVEVHFKPVAGFVWCPKCQKTFSPAAELREGKESEQDDADKKRNGEADECPRQSGCKRNPL